MTIVLSLTLTQGSALGAGAQPKLPVISQVGVVPAQWEEGGADAVPEAQRSSLNAGFPKAVRAAHRFRVLSDDLVESLWKDADGRDELRNDFELHSFMSLTVEPRGDTVTLTNRLLDPYLKSQMTESETVSRSWLWAASADAIDDKLEQLVFRLINRIPVDVSVTSVQGSYITLSGGAEQGIQVGDKVNLARATIKSVHPANGTWLEFDKKPLGSAAIIETKSHTSVARLLEVVKENAVEVGDGAKIPAIAGRAKFARMAKTDSFKDAGKPETIVVPPLYTDGSTPQAPKKSPAAPKPTPAPTEPLGDQVASTEGPAQDAPPPKETADVSSDKPAEAAPPAERQPGDAGPGLWDSVTDEVTGQKLIDDITAYVGPQWWSVKSKATAKAKSFSQSGKFPIWLLNSIGGGVSRTLAFKIKTGFGGGLLFGKTSDGSYVGYDTYARMYWEDELGIGNGLFKTWRAGGHASFSGMSVPKGKYGGGDWIRGGIFGGLAGSVTAGEGGDRYDWLGEFAIMPLNIGRIGFDGSRKGVESAFGTKLSLTVFRWEPARIIQWGGAFEMGDERQTLKTGQRVQFSDYAIKAMAKYAF